MFNTFQPGYRVWYRKSEPDALWNTLPYTPRESYNEALDLVDYYEGEWGALYEYTVVACGHRPTSGMCVPYV